LVIAVLWLLQFCGWLPIYLLQLPIFGEDNWLSFTTLTYATSVTFLAVLGSLVIRRLFNALNHKVTRGDLWIGVIIFAGLFVAFMVDLLHHSFWFVVALALEQFAVIYQSQPFSVITGFLWATYVFWGSLYLALTKQEKLNIALINQQKLALLVKENKINGLLEQLNPHFMFNAINNIRALILKDTEQAREMLASFADIMRYQINSDSEALVKLQDELAFVLEYIELNRLQLGKRLQFIQEVDSSLFINFIPRMALQLLVENAIKHGFSQNGTPAILKISINKAPTKAHPQAWFISVTNSGNLDDDKNTDSGIGLKNLEERLKLSFENNYELTLMAESDIVECKIQFSC
jgi:two-component system LytT family sensor kinase